MCDEEYSVAVVWLSPKALPLLDDRLREYLPNKWKLVIDDSEGQVWSIGMIRWIKEFWVVAAWEALFAKLDAEKISYDFMRVNDDDKEIRTGKVFSLDPRMKYNGNVLELA